MKLKDKYRQIKKEAGACVIALLVLIVFWAIAGLGVSHLGHHRLSWYMGFFYDNGSLDGEKGV